MIILDDNVWQPVVASYLTLTFIVIDILEGRFCAHLIILAAHTLSITQQRTTINSYSPLGRLQVQDGVSSTSHLMDLRRHSASIVLYQLVVFTAPGIVRGILTYTKVNYGRILDLGIISLKPIKKRIIVLVI